MFNDSKFIRFLRSGEMPMETALDEAIARENAKRDGVSEELMDEMLAFLRDGERDEEAAEDEEPMTLKRHDDIYHDGDWHEGDRCKFRERRKKNDDSDAAVAAAAAVQPTRKPPIPGLSKKKRDEYEALMKKNHPNLDAGKLLAELGKIGDKKVQGDAFRWVMKGAARLPEDLYKVEQARELADKAKKDPLSYNTPQACIDDLNGKVKPTVKPIDPNCVPELSDKRELPMGVTTYLVQDDQEGQRAMRKIIDTHWGKDANPWCLLAREESEDEEDDDASMSDAWHYWNHYNALPKRVAFKDGKLLAFMATDINENVLDEMLEKIYEEEEPDEGWYSLEGIPIHDFYDWKYWYGDNYIDQIKDSGVAKEQWWDRQDSDHEGIPLGNVPVPDDEYGRWSNFEIIDGKVKRVGAFEKGEIGKPGYVKWYDNGNIDFEVGKNGHATTYYDNGSPASIWSDELASHVRFYPTGDVKEITDNRYLCRGGGIATILFDKNGEVVQWLDQNGNGLRYGETEIVGNPDYSVKQAMLDYLPKARELFKNHPRGDRFTKKK